VDRRTQLTEAALDYVLAHGLIGLSLRPLAAALGTSDRMLVYHFGSKEALVTDVVALANRQIAATLEAEPVDVASVDELVRYAWEMLAGPGAGGAMVLYLELCVLTARDRERWAAAQDQLRGPWSTMLRGALDALGVAPARVPALADLLLDGIDGLLLHRMGADPAGADAAAAEFAHLFGAAAHRPGIDVSPS
jgi:AcrR family transcriptional regulator